LPKNEKYISVEKDGYIPYEAFDQKDKQTALDRIYNFEDIRLPNINMKLLYVAGLERCCRCDDPIPEAEVYYDKNYNPYCEFCYDEMFG
jgi:hypothetical protein